MPEISAHVADISVCLYYDDAAVAIDPTLRVGVVRGESGHDIIPELYPQFGEAARHLAQAALLAKDQTDAARLDGIALKLMARPFRDEERKIVLASLGRFTEFYHAQPKEAARLIAVGESRADASLDPTTLAAWTMLANQLMNLDEVLTK